MSNAVNTKGLLVLADRKNPVLDRNVFPRQHHIHSWVCGGARGVDFSDARVRMGRPQQLAVRHSRQENVVGEPRLAGHLRAGIDSAPRDADHAKLIPVGLWSISGCRSRVFFIRHAPSLGGLSAPSRYNLRYRTLLFWSAILSMAASTASKICK